MCIGVTQMWGEVVSGTAYTTTSGSFPTGWTKTSSNEQNKYLGLQANTNYIQTENFCQNGFTSIVVSARKVGGPSDAQKEITIEWVPEVGSAVVLGTVSPSGTGLADLTLSSFTNTPTANTSGSIKLSCKGASDNKGSGVGALTITYTTGTCGSTPPAEPFTVTLKDDNTDLTEESAGDGVTLPSRDGCDGYTFAGWTKTWTSAQSSWTATAPEIIPAGAYTPAADENLYPVYTKTESGSGSAFSKYEKVDFGGTITDGKYLISTGSFTMSGSARSGASFSPGTTEKTEYEYTIAVSGGVFTIKGPDNKYITGSNSNTGLSFGTDEPTANAGKWKYNASGIQNQGFNTRYIRAYQTQDFRHYTTSNGYDTYLYKRVEGSGSTTYYISEPDCSTPTPTPTCEKKVTISKGTPEIGSFSLNKEEGAYETCDAAFEVIVTPAVVEHYHVSAVTAPNSTSISDPDADGKYTITYAKETNAESVINVTYVEDTKYDVTWSVNGVESTNKAYHGAHPTLPAAPTSSCDETSTTFMGWAAEAWNGKLAAPTATVYTSAEAMPVVEAEGVKYFAVFAKAGEATSVTHTLTIADKTAATTYAEHSDTDDKGATWSGWYNYNDATHIGLNKKSDNHYLGSPLFAANVTSVRTVASNGSKNARSVYLRSENETAQPSVGDLGSVSVPANADDAELTFTLGETAFKQFYVYVSDPLQFHEFVVTLEGAPSYSDYMTTCCTKYNVNIAEGITNGSVSADVTKACEDAVVTLTVTPATNYHLKTLSVMNGETPVEVTENTFSMPAGNVIISATFEEDACTPLNTPSVTVSGKAYPYDAVKLAWTAIDNANLYKVYIYDAEDNELEKDEAFEGVEYTIDLDLEASTTYKYSVQAISNTPATYCPSTSATGTFATDALPTAHLTLIDAAGEHASSDDYTILTAFNLPNAAAVPQGCPKVFRGWDADENCNHAPAYAPGASFTFENTTGVTLHAVYAKEGAPAPVTYPIDFEANADTYTDWTLTNITSKQEDSGVNPHEGEYFGVTAGTATASLVTKEKIANPTSLTVFVSKKSTNTSASTWYAQVSEDGTNWTDVESVNGASMSKGAWVELSADLSSYSDVYVRVYYSGSTAVRCIDDLVLSAVGSASYSEYSTECEACKVVTLAKSGEDQDKGNTFTLKVGEEEVSGIQTCEAANVTIEPTVATGYQVSFAISELTGASLSENTISLAKDAEGELTVTANFTLKNHTVTLAQTPEIGATLVGGKEDAHYNETINLSTDVPTGYDFINWTSESVEITNATSANAASFTMPDADVTVTANFGKKYTVSFKVGEVTSLTEESVGAGVTLPSGPAPSEACVAAGWAFAGWAEAAVASETTNAQTLYTGEYHPTNDIELFAVYSRTESGDAPAKPSYVKANYADLVNGDAIVITNDNYALSTVTASKGQPVATAVTVAEDVITSLVEGLVWDITKGEENFSLTVHGGSDKLYSTNTNNGLRIGTEDNYLFNITDNYLFNIGTNRYAGVYNSEDWRNYETINSNIENQTLAFYKAVSAPTSTTYYWSAPECCTPHNVTIADNIEHGTVVANPTSACADATITVTLTAEEGYELQAWTVDGTEQALNATTFTMPNKDVVVRATFSEIVTPAADATLKLMENGHEVVFEGNHKVGDVVNLPNKLSDVAHACEGKVLKGWSAEAITTPVAAKPSENFYELGAEYTIATAADVLYAVFAEEVPGATNTTNITYSGVTTNMAVNTNEATKFGLDADQWSVIGAKGGASNNVGLNKAGDIRLYYHANGGNTLTITAPQTITSVGLTFSETYNNVWVKVGEETVALSDGVYPINATSFVIGNANTSNVQVRISKIEVNFTAEGTVANYATSCVEPLADPTFSLDPAVEPVEDEYHQAIKVVIANNAGEGATVYYTLNGATPTSASTEYTEPIALNTCGTTTIKAIAISATNHSEVVSAEYAIAIPIPTVSAEFPYTAEQAIAVYDGGCYNNEDVYVTGTVQTATLYNSGSYTVTLTNGFQFYYFYKAAGNEQFTAQDDVIGSGDVLVACGKLSKHNTTYQLASGCYLVSREAYTAPKTPIANEPENPYTVEQAIAYCNDGITYDLSDEVYVKGVVVAAPNSYGTFDIHDPELNEPTFQIFSGALSDALENAGVEIEANDTIIAHGQIKMHGSKPEMEGGIVVEVKKYVAPIVPEFTVNPTAVAFGNVEQNAPVGAIELNVGLTAIANATVTLADANGVFNINKTALTETGIVTVSVASTATVGEYAATITLHDEAAAAEDVVINVTMNVTEVETRNIANGSAFTAISGDLDPAHIKYAAFKGDGTTNPVINNSNIRLYKPDANNNKTTGGYLKLTALMGCTIDQVEITFKGNATASYSVNDAEFSTEAYITDATSLLTPAELNATSVSIVNLKNGSIDISAIKVYYKGSPLTVHHYILGGTYETTFEQNTEFSYEGLTVTAAYDEQETITEAVTGFTVEADLSTAGAKKAEVMLNSVKIAEYDITVNPGKANPNLTYTPESETIPAAEVGTWVAPTLNNTLHVAPITYSSSKQAVATVDENGVIALAGGYGTAVITASFAGDDDNIASEATYTITVQEPVNKIAGKWMVAGAEDIKPGIKVIVVGEKSGTKYAMGAQNTNNRAAVAAQSIVADTLYAAEGTKTFILVDAGEGLYAFQANNGMYLYAASNSSNQMKEQATLNDNGKWSIAIANDGEATIQAQGSNSRNLMSMTPNGNNNPLFSCYNSKQSAIKLYVNRNQIDGSDDPANPAEVAINDNVVEDEIVANGNVVVTVNTDNIEEPKSYIAQNGATIIITGTNPVAKNVVVEDGSRIEASVPTTTPNVYFATTMGSTQTPGSASELGSVENITLATGGEIIYDLTLGTSMAGIQADPNQWHAFTLPFAVSATEGIYDAETGAKLYNEVNYAIMDYHGDIRANGLYGWKKYSGILQPGVFYIMTVDGNTKTFRFKATQTGPMTQTTSMGYKAYNGSGDPSKDFGWNGIGNPSWVSGTVTVNVQVLDPYSYTYQPLTSSTNITVSTPFFYNAGGDGSTGSVVMQDAGTGANYAPARTPANEIKNVAVSFGNEVFRDKIYISASEDALNEYEQDKDLVRMIMSNTPKVAQIFGNAYGMKLSMVNAPMVNDQATYGLTLYAPNAGAYTIAVPEMENADIYLTYEGSIIWNLSMGEYTSDFAKGNNEGYGLLLVKKAPQVTTGVENAEANETGVQKVIINEHVYILRAEQMYDVTGKLVK